MPVGLFLLAIKVAELTPPSPKFEAGKLPPDSNFTYGPTTSTTTWRAHLGRLHIHEWVAAAKEGEWTISQTMETAMKKNGYSVGPQTAEEEAVNPQNRIAFSNAELVKHILTFIVSYDEVGSLFLKLYITSANVAH
jgi:hypothetical protein